MISRTMIINCRPMTLVTSQCSTKYILVLKWLRAMCASNLLVFTAGTHGQITAGTLRFRLFPAHTRRNPVEHLGTPLQARSIYCCRRFGTGQWKGRKMTSKYYAARHSVRFSNKALPEINESVHTMPLNWVSCKLFRFVFFL